MREKSRRRAFPIKNLLWLLPVETWFFLILVIGLSVDLLGSHNAMRISDEENAKLNDICCTGQERC